MNRLLEPNREGGYPLTGEALSILGSDMPAYINSILEQITLDNCVVFLSSSYAYVKYGGYKEIMQYTLTNITQADLIGGARSLSTITDTSASDVVGDTTYTNTRCTRSIAIQSSPLNIPERPKFYDLEGLLNRKLFNETDYINQLTATSQEIDDITITGHAILKGGMADISLILKFIGSGGIYISLPTALRSRGVVSMTYQNTNGNGIYYPIARIVDTTLTVAVVADNHEDGFVAVHFHYMPISSSIPLPNPDQGGITPGEVPSIG